jgi:ribosomal protein S18 acetylase RimI-like enzyme
MAKGHRFYIAETGEQILGFASVSDEGEHTFKLNKLYILPNIQRSGAGSALLDTCISFAKENRGQRLILQVNRQNPARHFYEKHGFSIREEIDLHVGEGFYMNDYVMEKDIS